jgi:glucose dehydrogenase
LTLRRRNIVLFAFALVLSAVLIYQVAGSWLAGPAPERDDRTVEVRADRDWQGTGVRVNAGQELTIRHVSGEWSPWPGGTYGPSGCPPPGCDHVTNLVTRDANHVALIARIGGGPPIAVNEGLTVRASLSGEVALRANDTAIDDNSGALRVSVSTRP